MVKYTAGSNKGETKQGDVFNDPFRLGKVDSNYTSSSVVETAAYADMDATNHTAYTLAWTPVTTGGVAKVSKFSSNTWTDLAASAYSVSGNVVTLTAALISGEKIKVAYVYDNVVIPQNDLPIVNAEIASIALIAKARRVAVNAYAA